MSDLVPLELVGVRLELPTNTPIVLLRELPGTRYLPIWIGAAEATAIAYAHEGVEPPRPQTHDLLKLLIDTLDAEVERVVVTALVNGIFHADLHLRHDGTGVVVGCRPSDAIALAVRTDSPLFAQPEVLDDAGVEIRDENEEEEVERFRRFLDDVTPEDFTAEQS